VKAAELRHRITVERKTVTRDAFGGESISWGIWQTLWAKAVPVRGDEQIEAQAVHAGHHVDFTFRYAGRGQGVTTQDRIVWDGDNYEIVDVRNQMGMDQWVVVRGVTGISET